MALALDEFLLRLRGAPLVEERLQFLEEVRVGTEAILMLFPFVIAPHSDPCGNMPKLHARAPLVSSLPPLPAPPRERLLNILRTHRETRGALDKTWREIRWK